MSFSDDDLKRLKNDWFDIRIKNENTLVLGTDEIAALLARLEAAEKVVEIATKWQTFRDDNYKAVKAWRRAKGENDSKAAGK